MDTAEDDHIGIGLSSTLAQSQGIANMVGEILDLFDLVVMREDNGIPLLLESKDLGYQISGV